jgi:hypothetical protein
MSADTDLVTSEREAIRQYADWYTQQGYEVSVEPSPRELPKFLRTLGPDMIARRDGENIVVEIKTSSPASFEAVQRLARALEHRAGWELQVVYVDLPDPEWQPPPRLPERKDLLARLDLIGGMSEGRGSEPPRISPVVVDYRGRRPLSALGLENPANQPDFLVGSAKDAADRGHHRGR